VTPSSIDGLAVDATTIRLSLKEWRGEDTLSSSATKAADVVAKRNPRASKFEG
jgi:hypothetical protein